MNRYLYLLPKDVAQAQAQKHFARAQWIDLGGEMVFLSGRFHNDDESHKDTFERNVSVKPCCHDGETVTEKHAGMLAHLGVKSGHSGSQVRSLAKKIHPLM